MIKKLRIEEARNPFGEEPTIIYIFETWDNVKDIDGNLVTIKIKEEQISKDEFESQVETINSKKEIVSDELIKYQEARSAIEKQIDTVK